MLACTETVTLVRHVKTAEGDSYTCEIIVGVSWFEKHGALVSSKGEAPENVVLVRIPARLVPEPLPEAGDHLVRGAIGGCSGLKDLAELECFRIAKVGDNRRGRLLPHVVCRSQ